MPPSTTYYPCASQQQHDHIAESAQFGAGPCPGVMSLYSYDRSPDHSQSSSSSASQDEDTSSGPMFCGCTFQDEIDDYDMPESPLEPSQDPYSTELSKSCTRDHPANFSHCAEPSPDDVGDMTRRQDTAAQKNSSHHVDHDHGPPLEPWAAAISEMVLYLPTPARIGPITFKEATTGLSWSGTTYTTCSCGATTRWTDFRPLHPVLRTSFV